MSIRLFSTSAQWWPWLFPDPLHNNTLTDCNPFFSAKGNASALKEVSNQKQKSTLKTTTTTTQTSSSTPNPFLDTFFLWYLDFWLSIKCDNQELRWRTDFRGSIKRMNDRRRRRCRLYQRWTNGLTSLFNRIILKWIIKISEWDLKS